MNALNIDKFWQDEAQEHVSVAQNTFSSLKGEFHILFKICVQCIDKNGKIIFFGNGGSAADAQHLATELTIRYKSDRDPIAALALTTDSSALTAAGNDLGFDRIFARQLEALARPEDVAIGISTSGKSPNVLSALEKARDMGLKTAGLTGANGNKMVDFCDVVLAVPSVTTARIQEMHITLGQMLCGALEQALYGES